MPEATDYDWTPGTIENLKCNFKNGKLDGKLTCEIWHVDYTGADPMNGVYPRDIYVDLNITFKDGVRHGDYKEETRYEMSNATTIKEGTYSDGKFTGKSYVVGSYDGYQKECIFENDEEVYKVLNDPIGGRFWEIRRNGPCWKKKRGVRQEKYEQKNGLLHGTYKLYDGEGNIKEEIEYVDGKRNGFSTSYNKDGVAVSKKYYRDDKDCTKHYARLKKIAKGNVSSDEKTVKPKRSKLAKNIAYFKATLSGNPKTL